MPLFFSGIRVQLAEGSPQETDSQQPENPTEQEAPVPRDVQSNDDIVINAVTSLDDLLVAIDGDDPDVAVKAILEFENRELRPEQLPNVVEALLNAAHKSNELIRIAAAEVCGQIGEPIAVHLEPFLKLDDGNPEIRKTFFEACTLIRKLGPDASMWVPVLTEALDHEDTSMRRAGLFGLDNMGPAALPALNRLIELLDDDDFNIQVGACQVIESIGADAATAVPRLVRLAEEGNISAKSWALIALGAIGPVAEHDTGQLIASRLDAFTFTEKHRALLGLSYFGPEALDYLEQVETLMTEEQLHCLPWGAYAYWRITGDSEKPLNVLTGLLSDESYRRDSLDRLAAMGPDAAGTAGTIIQALAGAEADVREQSMICLRNFGPAAASEIENVRVFLDDEDVLVRYYARKAIQAIETKD